MPGSMLTEEAFSTSQERSVASPALMAAGLAANLCTLGSLLPPPVSIVMQPAAASMIIRDTRIMLLISSPSCPNIKIKTYYMRGGYV
jgi:hypothetical protein